MRNETLRSWVMLVAAHAKPAAIVSCDGSDREWSSLCRQMREDGMVTPLDTARHPGSFLHRQHPTDTMRLDQRRFVCTPRREDAGPTNQWLPEEEAYRIVWPLFAGAMRGRTLYVVPYLLGAPGSKYAQVGVQLTDSPLVVARLRLLTRIGRPAMEHLGRTGDFLRGLHCLGDLLPERRYVVHFPATQTSWSIGSDHTEAAVSGHRWHVLNLVSAQAPEEGFLAEHMSVAEVKTPSGRRHYVGVALPSGCGKTQLCTLASTLPGYEVELAADGMCFLRVGADGRLWALNPAAGVESRLGVAEGRWSTPRREVIFSNAALASDGVVHRDGKPEPLGRAALEGRSRASIGAPARYAEARFAASARHCRSIGAGFEAADGVPLSAIIFGGRRSSLAPLVCEASSWDHGVYLGATLRTETETPDGEPGVLRSDPMAMLSYCAYNMADYFGHWLRLGQQLFPRPRIFRVNWFRRDSLGQLVWPGFGENVRVLDWIVRRVERSVDARSTPIGLVPYALNGDGLSLEPSAIERLHEVDVGAWLREAEESWAFMKQFGSRLPPGLRREHEALERRLRAANN